MASPGPPAARVIFVVGLAALGGGCGRTEIDLVEPCGRADTTRTCEDFCGTGTQTCRNGYWQRCVVPPTVRACAGVCGDGVQRCVDRRWRACEIPVTTRACSSVCGAGQETCMNEKWLACDAPQPRP